MVSLIRSRILTQGVRPSYGTPSKRVHGYADAHAASLLAVDEGHAMAPRTPLHVLVVDDEPGILRALTRFLQRDGHSVATAPDGQAALARLRADAYDVLLCDLRMPALDGQTFYGLLQRQHPSLCQRLIVLTGDT